MDLPWILESTTLPPPPSPRQILEPTGSLYTTAPPSLPPPVARQEISNLLNPKEESWSFDRKRKSSFTEESEAKRPANIPVLPHAKRQTKWSKEEDDLIIRLRREGLQWKQAAEHLPGRTAIACRLHYQNYLEDRQRGQWEQKMEQWEENMDELARLYHRMKSEMWANIARQLGVPWRTAECMHWYLGSYDMARRAKTTGIGIKVPNAFIGHEYLNKALDIPKLIGPDNWMERQSICLGALMKMKSKMWANIAKELGVRWRTAEAMHWHLSSDDMACRTGATEQ
ncbi:hypothetical protein MMC07_000623 [Pseudocyphellaria aurata]|nr:hypothetical protein [Pseudocyphellaria aurata]